jgi:flavin reductase (DIM6/NTAB) family NADH-FMN oxidoreductase RutF
LVKVELPAKLRFDFPTAIVVVSCSAGERGKPNLIAVGAISHACIDPPMLGVAIGHTRYTYEVISRSDGFVVNVPSKNQVEIVDYVGSVSGREVDKFKVCNLTPLPSTRISSPGILEFPLNIECAIRKSVDLGSHSFYFGEIVAVRCDESILKDGGKIDKEKLQPLSAFLEGYWTLGEQVQRFGESKKRRSKLARASTSDKGM